MNKRKIFVTSLQFVLAGLLILGAQLSTGSLRIIYYSYFADVIVPFGFYFLLFLLQNEYTVFEKWQVKSLSIFILCTSSEVLQYFGIYALARVFDPLDFVMYGIGVLVAVFVDRILFAKYLPFWE